MKTFSKSIITVFISTLLLSFFSCDNKNSYAEQLAAEKELIKKYISRNNIDVKSGTPTDDTEWSDNLFYKTKSGLYFQLINRGDVNEDYVIEVEDKVNIRYIQHTLDLISDTIYNWSTGNGTTYPHEFTYKGPTGSDDYSSVGWQEAVSYMKYNNSEAKIIVPSKLSFSSYEDAVTPIAYHIKISFSKY